MCIGIRTTRYELTTSEKTHRVLVKTVARYKWFFFSCPFLRFVVCVCVCILLGRAGVTPIVRGKRNLRNHYYTRCLKTRKKISNVHENRSIWRGSMYTYCLDWICCSSVRDFHTEWTRDFTIFDRRASVIARYYHIVNDLCWLKRNGEKSEFTFLSRGVSQY